MKTNSHTPQVNENFFDKRRSSHENTRIASNRAIKTQITNPNALDSVRDIQVNQNYFDKRRNSHETTRMASNKLIKTQLINPNALDNVRDILFNNRKMSEPNTRIKLSSFTDQEKLT